MIISHMDISFMWGMIAHFCQAQCLTYSIFHCPAWIHSRSCHLAVEILTQERPVQIQVLQPQHQPVASLLFKIRNFHQNSSSRRVQDGTLSPQLPGALKWKCLGYLNDLLYMRDVKYLRLKATCSEQNSLWYQCICFYFSLLKGIIVGIWAGLLTEGGKKHEAKPNHSTYNNN